MSNCIFCKIVSGVAPSWKVFENENVLAFLDINPLSRYHTLVIPKKHCKDIFEISEEDLKSVISVVQLITKKYKDILGINDVHILNNNGSHAQQEVFHIHYHIIPREKADGKNIRFTTHPELRRDFDAMIKRLNQ